MISGLATFLAFAGGSAFIAASLDGRAWMGHITQRVRESLEHDRTSSVPAICDGAGYDLSKFLTKTVCLRDSRHAGDIAEVMTRLMFTARGYTYIDGKNDPTHGIDAIFLRKNRSGGIEEVAIVETKANGASLSPKQMSDPWIEDRLKRAEKHAVDRGDQQRTEAIQEAITWFRGNDRVMRFVVRHFFTQGLTQIDFVDRDAQILYASELIHDFVPQFFIEAFENGWLNFNAVTPSSRLAA